MAFLLSKAIYRGYRWRTDGWIDYVQATTLKSTELRTKRPVWAYWLSPMRYARRIQLGLSGQRAFRWWPICPGWLTNLT